MEQFPQNIVGQGQAVVCHHAFCLEQPADAAEYSRNAHKHSLDGAGECVGDGLYAGGDLHCAQKHGLGLGRKEGKLPDKSGQNGK